MKFNINTSIYEEGMIIQTLDVEHEEIMEKILRQVIYTKEIHIRDALIKLGWTPPKADEPPKVDDYTPSQGELSGIYQNRRLRPRRGR